MKDDSLFDPVHSGNAQLLDKLLKEGKGLQDEPYPFGDTPLHEIIGYQSIEMLNVVLANNQQVDIENEAGFTPLHLAVLDKAMSMVKPLVEYGANVNSVDKRGYPILCTAVETGNIPIAELLLEYKGDPNQVIKVYKNIVDIYDVETIPPQINNATSIHVASWKGEIKIVKLLIKYGADHELKAYNPTTNKEVSIYDLFNENFPGREEEFKQAIVEGLEARKHLIKSPESEVQEENKLNSNKKRTFEEYPNCDAICKSVIAVNHEPHSFNEVDVLVVNQNSSTFHQELLKKQKLRDISDKQMLATPLPPRR